MKFLRRVLGILVMIAGVLGLLLSLAGLVGIWIAKPAVATGADSTIDTLSQSVDSSRQLMAITAQALGATVESVDALSTMLSSTATTVQETGPVLDQIDVVMADTLPTTLQSATDALLTAQDAAVILESTIQSLDAFRFLLGSNPLLSAFVQLPEESYSPAKPLAETLGDLATSLEGLPGTFVEMSGNLSSSTDNLVTVQSSLATMSTSVGRISASLSEYEAMVIQSQTSMEDVQGILDNLRDGLPTILNWVVIVLTVFLAWLLAAQVVILSQGWELFQGTAGSMAAADDGADA